MSLQVIKDIDQFEKLRLAWSKLTDEPLRSFEWHFAWWKHLGGDRELRIYAYETSGEIVGIAPFYFDSWMGQSRLRYVASGSTCTDYAESIVKPEFEAEFLAAITEDLKQNTTVAIVELDGVSTITQDKLAQDLDNWPFRRYQSELEPSWILTIPDSWEQFLASSKKSLRRKVKKASKRLDSGEITVQSSLKDIGLDQAFEILVKLHQERFKSKGHAGVFADPQFKAFLYEAVTTLSETNRAEILIGFSGSEPIGAHLYLHGARGGQLYQSGMASKFKALEPGHVMLTFAVKRAIEQKNDVFDFLRGDEPYKPYWGAVPHQLMKVEWVSKSIVPTAINQSYRAAQKAKQICERWFQSLTPKHSH